MKPGKELDALIAEHVMGAKEVLAKPEGATYLFRKGDYLYEDPPSYSTEIAQAWEVLAVLAEKGWDYSVFNTEFEGIYCQFYTRERGYIESSAETAPLAICLAALKVVGIKL